MNFRNDGDGGHAIGDRIQEIPDSPAGALNRLNGMTAMGDLSTSRLLDFTNGFYGFYGFFANELN